MFLFQTAEKAIRYGKGPEQAKKDERVHPSVSGGVELGSGNSFYLMPGISYQNTSLNLRYDWGNGQKPGVYPWISTASQKYGSFGWGLAQNGMSVAGAQVGFALNNGYAAYYNYFGKLKDGKLDISSQGGASDPYGLWKFANSLKAGTTDIGTDLGAVKAVVDGGYSIVKRAIEALWPDIKLGGGVPPTKKALESVRNGTALQDGSDGKKAAVEREDGVKYCMSVLQYEKGEKEDRQKAAVILSELFREDMAAMKGGGNKFNFADWDRVMEAVGKNKEFFASETIGSMQGGLDQWKCYAAGGKKTLGFLQNAMNGGGIGGGTAALAASIFSADELSVGLPLDMRWHGWNVPWTAIDTAIHWFDDIGSFKNTRENHGFFGKVLGFFEDVVHDVLSVPSKIIGSVSPVYRRGDAWAKDAAENVGKAIDENGQIIAKLTAWGKYDVGDLKKLCSNLAYLGEMLPAVAGNDEKLAGRLRSHLGKNELLYTIFSSKVARMEMDGAIAEFEGGKHKGTAIEDNIVKFIDQIASRLSDSYVYLRLVDQKGLGRELASEVRYERSAVRGKIEEIAKKYTGYAPLLDQQEDAYQVAKAIQNGGLDSDWKAVSQSIGSGIAPTDKSRKDALARLNKAMGYANGYRTVGQLAESWALANKEIVRDAMGGFAEKIAPQIENADGKTDLAVLQGNFGFLCSMRNTLGRAAGETGENEAICKAMDKLQKKLDVDYDDLKTAEQKQKFMAGLNTYALVFNYLKSMDKNGMAGASHIKDWQEQASKAAKTLYGLTKEAEKDRTRAGEQKKEDFVGAWKIMGAIFGEDALSGLSKKEKDYVESILRANQPSPA